MPPAPALPPFPSIRLHIPSAAHCVRHAPHLACRHVLVVCARCLGLECQAIDALRLLLLGGDGVPASVDVCPPNKGQSVSDVRMGSAPAGWDEPGLASPGGGSHARHGPKPSTLNPKPSAWPRAPPSLRGLVQPPSLIARS
eukprot:351509-Chlamydomonas_euryale.AAC.5